MRTVTIICGFLMTLTFTTTAHAGAKKNGIKKPASVELTCANAAGLREEVATVVEECLGTQKNSHIFCADPKEAAIQKKLCTEWNEKFAKLACPGVEIVAECEKIK